jgi:hypothetical protein
MRHALRISKANGYIADPATDDSTRGTEMGSGLAGRVCHGVVTPIDPLSAERAGALRLRRMAPSAPIVPSP